MSARKLSLLQTSRKLPDNESAEQWFIKRLWENGVKRAHCGSQRVTERQKAGKRAFRCTDCRRDCSTETATVIDGANIGSREWPIANLLMTTNIKGTSSTKLAHDIGIPQKSTWYTAIRIREVYKGHDFILIENVVGVRGKRLLENFSW